MQAPSVLVVGRVRDSAVAGGGVVCRVALLGLLVLGMLLVGGGAGGTRANRAGCLCAAQAAALVAPLAGLLLVGAELEGARLLALLVVQRHGVLGALAQLRHRDLALACIALKGRKFEQNAVA